MHNDTHSTLHCIARIGNDEAIKILETLARLELDLHIQETDGTIPLHEAATAEVAEFFLTHGARVNAKTTMAIPPYIWLKMRPLRWCFLNMEQIETNQTIKETPLFILQRQKIVSVW